MKKSTAIVVTTAWVTLAVGCASTSSPGPSPIGSTDAATVDAGATDGRPAPVVKSGKARWGKLIDNGEALGVAAAFGPAGDVYFAFNYRDATNIDGLPLPSSSSSQRAGVAAFTRDGVVRWAINLDPCTVLRGMAVDSDGDVMVGLDAYAGAPPEFKWAANTTGLVKLHASDGSVAWASVTPGGPSGGTSIVGTGSGAVLQGQYNNKAITTRFDSQGAVVWQKFDLLDGYLAKNTSGDLFSAHSVAMKTLQGQMFSSKSLEIVLARADLQGVGKSVKGFDTTGPVFVGGLAASSSGVVAAGSLNVNGDTGAGPQSSPAAFLQAYDLTGKPTWSHFYAQQVVGNNGSVQDVAAAPDGDWVATGYVNDEVDLGKGPASKSSFVMRLSSTGTPIWVKTDDIVRQTWSVTVGPDGSVATTGRSGGAALLSVYEP